MALSEKTIRERLAAYQNWILGEDGRLRCLKVFRNFNRMMLFVTAVGYIAEALDHHPDLFLHDYRKLMISVMSHDEAGITDRDFELITQIEALPVSDQ